jgi:hypothetical protein
MIKNTSKNEGITDLRLRYTLPWAVITSRLESQQGFEGFALESGGKDAFRVGKGNNITSLVEFWTNVIEINATALFPEAVLHGKFVMSVDGYVPGKPGLLSVAYRDRSGVTKTSFAQTISVIDAANGSIRIDQEPLKGTFEVYMLLQPKEPISFPAKNR